MIGVFFSPLKPAPSRPVHLRPISECDINVNFERLSYSTQLTHIFPLRTSTCGSIIPWLDFMKGSERVEQIWLTQFSDSGASRCAAVARSPNPDASLASVFRRRNCPFNCSTRSFPPFMQLHIENNVSRFRATAYGLSTVESFREIRVDGSNPASPGRYSC
ncbi:hypothetical protein DFH94DRAFT_365058 [Russula ochroleuca]|jgi:hypothetical protein|uniref:Uncharacterized protein n=1 Tax=Russula ochroleuca TaxID=152965 RepID=A0A9P5MZI0_9AGAM|nr:hypothetical protein DFH94DRAFT_365058 [Russula ochroleuca]